MSRTPSLPAPPRARSPRERTSGTWSTCSSTASTKEHTHDYQAPAPRIRGRDRFGWIAGDLSGGRMVRVFRAGLAEAMVASVCEREIPARVRDAHGGRRFVDHRRAVVDTHAGERAHVGRGGEVPALGRYWKHPANPGSRSRTRQPGARL